MEFKIYKNHLPLMLQKISEIEKKNLFSLAFGFTSMVKAKNVSH
jgi:hypothetical protein